VILVDDAIYPFKGRMWCHMVSDLSLDELHAFASGLGIPRGAFQDHPRRNHPHYDIPDSLRTEAIQLGAQQVTGRELVRRMVRHPDDRQTSTKAD